MKTKLWRIRGMFALQVGQKMTASCGWSSGTRARMARVFAAAWTHAVAAAPGDGFWAAVREMQAGL